MKKIESIVIEGFQAHEQITLELGPGITTIVGPTNVGKSSLIRAIRWAALNSNRGFDFLRTGAKQARVVLTGEGAAIERLRGKDRNAYGLSVPNALPLNYDAVSGTVPPQISGILKIDEDNFQNQHDLAFWLSQTAGEVARCLNKRVKLDVIDDHLSGAAALVKRSSIAKDLSKEAFTAARDRYRALDYVDACAVDAQYLKTLLSIYQDKSKVLTRLGPMIEAAIDSRKQAKELEAHVEAMEAVIQLGSHWATKDRALNRLGTLITALEVAGPVANQEVPDIGRLEVIAGTIKLAASQAARLQDLTCTASAWRTEVQTQTETLELEEQSFKEQIKEGCPLCGK